MHAKDSHDCVNQIDIKWKLAVGAPIVQGQEVNSILFFLHIAINSEVHHKSLCGLLVYNFPCKKGNYYPEEPTDSIRDLGDKI